MISRVSGTLMAKELDRVEIMTSGGVAYELSVPLSVFEMPGRVGDAVELHTYLVVRDDGWPRVGRKKAEQMILGLADKLDDLQVPGAPAGPRPQGANADDAMRALVSLGYSNSDAERAV